MSTHRLKILYRDRELVAVHKPSGMNVYNDGPNEPEPSAYDLLKEQLGAPVFPVHRLDKGTCGVVLFALSSPMAARCQELFRGKSARKRYLAVVFGTPPAQAGETRTPLPAHKGEGTLPAWTLYRLVWSGSLRDSEAANELPISIVECDPRTGRYHQIRRHLKGLGCPIAGDEECAPAAANELFAKITRVRRMCLSSIELDFPHPTNRKPTRIQTGPDKDLAKLIDRLTGKKNVAPAAPKPKPATKPSRRPASRPSRSSKSRGSRS